MVIGQYILEVSIFDDSKKEKKKFQYLNEGERRNMRCQDLFEMHHGQCVYFLSLYNFLTDLITIEVAIKFPTYK